jgi:DNA polymerase delta subunit 1
MKRTGTYTNNAGPKKSRGFEDEGPSFEEELGMMDQMEGGDEFIEGLDPNESAENQVVRWARPLQSNVLDPKKDDLSFHWLDIDMTSGNPMDSNPDGTDIVGAAEGPVPIIRMYGVTGEGQSVMANIHGFTPYLYVSFPPSVSINDAVLGQLRAVLDQKV